MNAAPVDARARLCAVRKPPPPVPNAPAKPDVIKALTGMLERAKRGQVIGIIAVVANADGEDAMSISGEFRDDLDYARAAAREGFDLLLGHWAAQAKDLRPHRPPSAVMEPSPPIRGHLRIV